jgi:hypothetical protein
MEEVMTMFGQNGMFDHVGKLVGIEDNHATIRNAADGRAQTIMEDIQERWNLQIYPTDSQSLTPTRVWSDEIPPPKAGEGKYRFSFSHVLPALKVFVYAPQSISENIAKDVKVQASLEELTKQLSEWNQEYAEKATGLTDEGLKLVIDQFYQSTLEEVNDQLAFVKRKEQEDRHLRVCSIFAQATAALVLISIIARRPAFYCLTLLTAACTAELMRRTWKSRIPDTADKTEASITKISAREGKSELVEPKDSLKIPSETLSESLVGTTDAKQKWKEFYDYRHESPSASMSAPSPMMTRELEAMLEDKIDASCPFVDSRYIVLKNYSQKKTSDRNPNWEDPSKKA